MNFKSRFPAALPLLLAALLCGCSSVTVSSDYDPEVDFAPYRNYGWLALPAENQSQALSPLLQERIVRAVDAELQERGYVKADSGSPDFLVGYHLRVENKLDVQTINRSYGYGYGRYGRWGYPAGGYSETRVSEYAQGTFILDIVDGASNELVWRGSAEGRLKDRKSPEEREKAVNETVAAVLKKFPPES